MTKLGQGMGFYGTENKHSENNSHNNWNTATGISRKKLPGHNKISKWKIKYIAYDLISRNMRKKTRHEILIRKSLLLSFSNVVLILTKKKK